MPPFCDPGSHAFLFLAPFQHHLATLGGRRRFFLDVKTISGIHFKSLLGIEARNCFLGGLCLSHFSVHA